MKIFSFALMEYSELMQWILKDVSSLTELDRSRIASAINVRERQAT
jgi:hypothetical protein